MAWSAVMMLALFIWVPQVLRITQMSQVLVMMRQQTGTYPDHNMLPSLLIVVSRFWMPQQMFYRT